MSFGWSAGDIATAINVVMEICKALDDTFGASSEYQDFKFFLQTLNYTLDILLRIDENDGFEHAAQLSKQIQIMKPKVTQLLEIIEKKYDPNIGKDSTRKFRAFKGKLEWAWIFSAKAKELRGSITSSMATIDRWLLFDILSNQKLLGQMPTHLQTGFSGVESQINSSMQLIHADISQNFSLMQKKIIEDTVKAILQIQSRGTSPQPPPYTSAAPPAKSCEASRTVAAIMKRYRDLPLKKVDSGFQLPKDQGEVFSIDSSSYENLEGWLRSTTSEMLYIREPPSRKTPLSVAGALFTAGKYTETQVVGHSLAKNQRWVGGSTPRKILADLISSLVHQLIERLPALTRSRTKSNSKDPLLSARFSVLGQHNMIAISASLSILGDLIDFTSEPFLIILDCFERYNQVKDKMVLDRMQTLFANFRKNPTIKLFLSASDPSHLAGLTGVQSRKPLKEEQKCFPVSPNLVELLNSLSKEAGRPDP